MTPALIIGGIVPCSGSRACSATSPRRSPPRKRPAAGADQSTILLGSGHERPRARGRGAVLGPAQVRLTRGWARWPSSSSWGRPVAQCRNFWIKHQAVRRDQVIDRSPRTPLPFRVFKSTGPGRLSRICVMGVRYPLTCSVPRQRAGDTYDELWGRKNEWRNLGVLHVVGPVGCALRDPAGGCPDSRLDSRVAACCELGWDESFDGARVNPIRALGASALRPRVAARFKRGLGGHSSDALLHPRMDVSRDVLFTNDQPIHA